MSSILTIIRRELGSTFTSPVAYVFLVMFLVLTGFFTFMIGGFFVRNEADLNSFFFWFYYILFFFYCFNFHFCFLFFFYFFFLWFLFIQSK